MWLGHSQLLRAMVSTFQILSFRHFGPKIRNALKMCTAKRFILVWLAHVWQRQRKTVWAWLDY